MGDEQRLTPDEQIAFAREGFESATDFTVAVEEEFALLDPETLELINRFEKLQAAALGTEVESPLVGELIASEVEIRTGRCEHFGEAAERMVERRGQLRALAAKLGLGLASIGTHPWSRWQDQRIIDTPHYRRNDEILRYVVWRNNSFGMHVHVAIRGGDRAVAVCNAFCNVLPELLAFSTSTRRCGGACGRIWRFQRSRCGSATRSPTSSTRRRSRRSSTRSVRGSHARSTTVNRCRRCRIVSSRR